MNISLIPSQLNIIISEHIHDSYLNHALWNTLPQNSFQPNLTTILLLFICYDLADARDLVTTVFTISLIVWELATISDQWYLATDFNCHYLQFLCYSQPLLAISFQVPVYNSRPSNYVQYLCYHWQYNSIQGITVALSVNQTYMVSIYHKK